MNSRKLCLRNNEQRQKKDKMASNGKTNDCSILSKLGLKPLTKCNLVKFYVPMAGAASHAAMSVSVMNPSLAAR